MSKYKNIRQLDATDCAAATLASVCMFYDLDITISRLRDVCGTDIKGTSVNGIILAANKLNFDVKAVRIPIEDFYSSKIALPFIAHGIAKDNMTHYIVVYKIGKKHLIVADPAKKERKISKKEFETFYDGVSILLKPNSDFVGGSVKSTGIFTKFLKLLLPHKRLFASAIVASVILTILGIVSNFFNQILIDDILPYNLKNQLTIFCIGFLIISVINIVLSFFRQHILLYLSQK